MQQRTCECGCGLPVTKRFRHGHYARTVPNGPDHPNWKSGRQIDERGYVRIRIPGRKGYVREHRWVMSRILGRPLLPTEVVHHKDGNKQNNAPENLELLANQSEHLKHAHGDPNWRRRKVPLQKRPCHCGKPMKAKGLCDTHYAASRRKVLNPRPKSGYHRDTCWCGKPHVARGLCDPHYREARRLGFPPHLGTLLLKRKSHLAEPITTTPGVDEPI